jgi:catechol 2,3-dioxygenase-like lactoylglutathione lyase family enzyme
MMSYAQRMPLHSIPPEAVALVPEIEVSDFARTLHFYVEVLGFSILYDRPERPFAYLTLGAAHIMIEHGGTWITGALEKPFGRGMNFQITVPDAAAIATRLAVEGWPLFRPMEEAWYRRSNEYVGARELVVQDPDGYLLRFSQHLGLRQA